MSHLIEARDLTVTARTASGVRTLVDRVSFTVDTGQTLGIIGESGSGKTTLARTLVGLLQHNLDTTAGTIEIGGETYFDAGTIDRRAELRGSDVGFVFQSTVESLDPLMRIGHQIAEIIRTHRRDVGRRAALAQAQELLGQLGFRDPAAVARSYPHELSGGMKQRVGIAAAIVTEPRVLLADEPTSALDLSTQAEVVGLLASLQKRLGIGMIFVTHDLNLASEIAANLLVMKDGVVVESGPTEAILANPADPYTVELLAARPSWESVDA